MKPVTIFLSLSICMNCLFLLTSFNTNREEVPSFSFNIGDTLIDALDFSDTVVGMANIIPTEQAKRYVNNMKGFRWWHHKASSSVWFDKKAIQYLGDFLDRDVANKYDGVRVHLIQYDKKRTAEGQRYRKQISILFVPTVEKKSCWEALKPKVGIRAYDALNHGELCPNNCEQ